MRQYSIIDIIFTFFIYMGYLETSDIALDFVPQIPEHMKSSYLLRHNQVSSPLGSLSENLYKDDICFSLGHKN